ncbi:uncharacterized protein LOC111431362 [Cucurbita moschata]|uniref:Uncharacterized protein LOC111431362 n=1 Tax=Cucurbita moschata TaxID=3662 RepID=A0A6J1E798_CUCMO|nr:uncharacterized protein LOC111431362 [Cucurbita moschata]
MAEQNNDIPLAMEEVSGDEARQDESFDIPVIEVAETSKPDDITEESIDIPVIAVAETSEPEDITEKGIDVIDIPATTEVNEPESCNVEVIVHINTPKMKPKILSRYLLPHTGSCHDFCKYGAKQDLEGKPARSILRKAKSMGGGGRDLRRIMVLLAKQNTISPKSSPDYNAINITDVKEDIISFPEIVTPSPKRPLPSIKEVQAASVHYRRTKLNLSRSKASSFARQVSSRTKRNKELRKDKKQDGDGSSSSCTNSTSRCQERNISAEEDMKDLVPRVLFRVPRNRVKRVTIADKKITGRCGLKRPKHPRKYKPDPFNNEDVEEKTLYMIEPSTKNETEELAQNSVQTAESRSQSSSATDNSLKHEQESDGSSVLPPLSVKKNMRHARNRTSPKILSTKNETEELTQKCIQTAVSRPQSSSATDNSLKHEQESDGSPIVPPLSVKKNVRRARKRTSTKILSTKNEIEELTQNSVQTAESRLQYSSATDNSLKHEQESDGALIVSPLSVKKNVRRSRSRTSPKILSTKNETEELAQNSVQTAESRPQSSFATDNRLKHQLESGGAPIVSPWSVKKNVRRVRNRTSPKILSTKNETEELTLNRVQTAVFRPQSSFATYNSLKHQQESDRAPIVPPLSVKKNVRRARNRTTPKSLSTFPSVSKEFKGISKSLSTSPLVSKEFKGISKSLSTSPLVSKEFKGISKSLSTSPLVPKEFRGISKSLSTSPSVSKEFKGIRHKRFGMAHMTETRSAPSSPFSSRYPSERVHVEHRGSTSGNDMKKSENSKVELKLKTRRMALSDSGDSQSRKLKFRKGRMLELQTETSTPRRLKFRRVRLLGEIQSPKVDLRNRNMKGKEANQNGIEVKEDEKEFKRKKIFRRKETIEGKFISSRLKSERVVLRHQDSRGKKETLNLLNNVIEETASKLAQTRNSKVKALVGAFETVISLQDTRTLAAGVA